MPVTTVTPSAGRCCIPLTDLHDYLVEHQAELMGGAGAAIMQQIQRDPKAAEAFALTVQQAQRGPVQRSVGAGAASCLGHRCSSRPDPPVDVHDRSAHRHGSRPDLPTRRYGLSCGLL